MTVTHDLETLARWVERDPRWLDLELRAGLARELRHPTAATLTYNVWLIESDDDAPPAVHAAAERLQALIDELTTPQLAALIEAA